MVLEPHGSSLSVCTKWVAMVLNELNVPSKSFPVDLKNQKQPFGKIPFIVDDGFVLYESRAIYRYIATKYADQGPPLVPKDSHAWAKLEQAASVGLCNFDTYTYDRILSKQKYLGGDEFTLADLFHIPISTLLPRAGFHTLQGKPNWLHSRPSWQAVKETVQGTA
ncbi:hypothetical protein BDN71DRAFT_1484400 [Pleurotus eryngii]|uniref:glutathione transferase n=1 Tax=Pleurotus eryngii TaxID=5323 RepID=A0A9P5ZRS9_PLEER|nr:hypothetical protein BDN71DRAFT_1484400 [Pleurotus eryngii]